MGRRCPKCNGGSKKSKSQWEGEVYKLGNGEYTCLSPYKNNRTHILMKHNVCGYEWLIMPSNFIKGHRCPHCANLSTSKKLSLNPEIFKSNFYKEANNEYELLSDYHRSHSKVKIKHIVCGHEFEMLPHNFLRGQRCPYCAPKSYGEERIMNWLIKNNYIFKKEYSFDDLVYKHKLRFDFAIFDINNNIIALIEFDGRQHYIYEESSNWTFSYDDFLDLQYRDEMKNNYCIKNNYNLLRIKFNELDIIEDILNKFLGKSPETIPKAEKQ